MRPDLALVFLIYVAALQSRKKSANILIFQPKFQRDLTAVRAWLAERGVTL